MVIGSCSILLLVEGRFGPRSLLGFRVDVGVEERGEAEVIVELTAHAAVPYQLLHASLVSMSSVRFNGRTV